MGINERSKDRCRDRLETTKEFLKLTGVNPERLYLGGVSAAEGQQFAQIVASFTDKLTAIGTAGRRRSREQWQDAGESDRSHGSDSQ